MSRAMILAIDGPAASGKGTLAGALARHYGLPHLDTGLLYRAVARAVLDAGGDLADAGAAEALARALDLAAHDAAALRERRIGDAASVVAQHPGVRRALFDRQRGFALREGGAVLDGRDVGRVVVPEADVKLMVIADPGVRADRRWRELAARGEAAALADVLADVLARDARDAANTAPAPDARLLDTSTLDKQAAVRAAVALIDGVLRARTPSPI